MRDELPATLPAWHVRHVPWQDGWQLKADAIKRVVGGDEAMVIQVQLVAIVTIILEQLLSRGCGTVRHDIERLLAELVVLQEVGAAVSVTSVAMRLVVEHVRKRDEILATTNCERARPNQIKRPQIRLQGGRRSDFSRGRTIDGLCHRGCHNFLQSAAVSALAFVGSHCMPLVFQQIQLLVRERVRQRNVRRQRLHMWCRRIHVRHSTAGTKTPTCIVQ